MNKTIKSILTRLITTIGLLVYTINGHSNPDTNFVNFAWDPSPDSSVIGYKLYANINVYNASNILSHSVQHRDFQSGKTNLVYATAYDVMLLESEPSNILEFYKPAPVFLLSHSSLNNNTFILNWAAHTNSVVNAYNIWVSTNNGSSFNKIASVSNRLTTNYVVYTTNLVNSITNYIAVTAYNSVPPQGGPQYIMESSLSTNLPIRLSPRGPQNLRIRLSISSSQNLNNWIEETNLTYYTQTTNNVNFYRGLVAITPTQ